MVTDKLVELQNGTDRPLLCLEVNPPRGSDVQAVFAKLKGQVEGVDFFNVTDCALARMKLAALPFSALLKQEFGIEVLANVACRDRNLIAIQADLLAAWALGVRSVVALTGDAVTIGDAPDRKGVFEVNSIGLLHAINSLNNGRDLAGNELKGKTQFVCGVVVNPNARNAAAELSRLQRKKEAGAKYALSQPVFDAENSQNFFRQAKSIGVPILMGLMALKSVKAARMATNIPGIRLSRDLEDMLAKSGEADLSGFFLDFCLRLASLNREHVAGYHVITGASPALALELAGRLLASIRGGA